MSTHRVIHGHWFSAGSSRAQAATLRVDSQGQIRVNNAQDTLLASGQVTDWQITDRLGNTPRTLYAPDGGAFTTNDLGAVDSLERAFKPSWLTRIVHPLESRLRYILPTLVIVVLFGWATVAWGVPALAAILADRIPRAAVEQLTTETLAIADRAWFEDSQLDDATRERLAEHFQPILDDHPNLDLTLLYRGGGPLGPNAVALPDGRMIMTDELVALAEHDDELAAVLLHEIGHIEHQHGLRSVIQGSILGMALVLITGDASATAEVLLGAPLIINELAYSRRFEFEADAYARDYMLANDMDLSHFHRILWRLSYGDTPEPDADNLQDAVDDQGDSAWARYLQTHPPTPERIERFQPED